jgi:hypothetical protein
MAVVTDWWDEEAQVKRENRDSLRLFQIVASRFRKKLKRPVWAHDVLHDGGAVSYRNIGYSVGASDWVKTGGELAQAGRTLDTPGNVRFVPEKPETGTA